MGKMVALTALNILRTTKAMSMNFCIVNTSRYQILIWDAKYRASFSIFLAVRRSFQKMDCMRNQIPSPLPTPVLTRLSYSDVIRVKMVVLKRWIFFEDIWNFNKWKSLIKDKKCWMLQNAMLSKVNDNFTTALISTENVEKIVEKVRRKNQTYFFSKLLSDYCKITFSGKILYFKNFDQECT